MGAACRAMCVRFLVFASFAIPASTASVDADASRVALRPVVPGQLRRGVGRLRSGSAGSIAAGSKVPCRFEVYAGALHQDDVVMLLGCGGGLEWSEEKAIKLEPASQDQSWWTAEVEQAVGEEIQYKFAIRNGAGQLRWEQGDNRVFVIPDEHRPVLCSFFAEHQVYLTSEEGGGPQSVPSKGAKLLGLKKGTAVL